MALPKKILIARIVLFLVVVLILGLATTTFFHFNSVEAHQERQTQEQIERQEQKYRAGRSGTYYWDQRTDLCFRVLGPVLAPTSETLVPCTEKVWAEIKK